jgi:PST family polysaccharide transporter
MTDQAQDQHEAEGSSSAEAVREPGRIGKNIAALGAGQLFTWTMTLAWTLVVPRLLGPGDMGLITTGIAVAGILQLVLGAGTGPYVARELVVTPERSARLVMAALVFRLLLMPGFIAAVVIWAQLAHYSAEGKLVLYLSGGATALYLLAEPAQSFFQAIERMHYRAIGEAINKAAQGLAGIVLTLLGFGALGFAGCWLVMSGVVLVLGLRWTGKHVRLDFRTTWQDVRAMARGSLVYWTNGVFYMIYLWIDTAMLSVMTNPTVVGWYGVPTKLFQTMMTVPGMIATAWLPQMVRAAQRSRGDLNTVARTPVAWVLGLAVPIAAVTAASASSIVHVVYGPAYGRAVPVLIILGLGLVPMYLSMILGMICIAANRQGRWTWLMVGATIVNPAINALLIPLTQHHFHNGAIGAAIALVATETLVACGGIVVVGPQVFGVATFKRVARAGVAAAGMGIVVYATRSAGAFLSLAAGGIALVTLACICGAVSRDERRQVRERIGRIAGKYTGRFTARRHRSATTETAAVVHSRAWTGGRRVVPAVVPVAALANVAAPSEDSHVPERHVGAQELSGSSR